MNQSVRQTLLALNYSFYEGFAAAFAVSRANPQPGFEELLSFLPQPCEQVLDVGCGEGRFGRFLNAVHPGVSYTGVDFSERLVTHARQSLPQGTFYYRDLSRGDCLADLGTFDLVASLAVLQHIPGRDARVRLLASMRERLRPHGKIFLSTWQFLSSARQRKKIAKWERVGLSDGELEEGDYLMTWHAQGEGLRYVAHIDRHEVHALASDAGLTVVDAFRSDGLEGDLNLYTILALPE